MKTLALAAFVVCALAGCSSGGGDTSSGGTGGGTSASGDGKKMTIGVVFDSGGIGDGSFNDSANRGAQKAKTDLGAEIKPVDSKSTKDFEPNLTALAQHKCDIIFAIGITQETALKAVAAKYPQQKFAIVDGTVDLPNVRCLKFNEQEGSFLAGYLAALTSKSGKLGFVGGMQIPLIEKFYAGYAAGAVTANPKVEVLPAKYTGSWDNVDAGKSDAGILYGQGADIVYGAAGRAGGGIITAAKEQGKLAIGVDSDQDGIEKGFVLTSMIKHVDESVFSTIQDVKDGKFTPGDKIYDLKSNGVGLSEMKYTQDKLPPDAKKKLDDIKAKIISGEIKVPTTEAELTAFLAAAKK
jgi:basic membrane protein A